MKKLMMAIGIIGILTGVGFSQEPTSIAPDMVVNLNAVNAIMAHLIVDENYQPVVNDCAQISAHAKDIFEKSPSKDPASIKRFQSYALQLEANADILKVLAEKIQKSNEEKLDTGTLKKTAALTFGQIVTSCVSCHQEYRVR